MRAEGSSVGELGPGSGCWLMCSAVGFGLNCCIRDMGELCKFITGDSSIMGDMIIFIRNLAFFWNGWLAVGDFGSEPAVRLVNIGHDVAARPKGTTDWRANVQLLVVV